MNISTQKFLEYVFFFAVLTGSGYLVWQLFSPFISAIALAAIVVTICYPLYEKVLKIVPRNNKSVASLASLFLVMIIIVAPIFALGSLILREALSIYTLVNSSNHVSFIDFLSKIETFIQVFIPSFSLDTANVVQQTASFIANHLVSVFTNTASTLFLFFIALIASYYFFRDGKYFTAYLIKLSPLKGANDVLIIRRLAIAVRSVALGTVSIALLQGVLTAIGLSIFGFDRAILWGCVAAIGALVPGVGTTVVFIPAVLYLIATGSQLAAIALGIWGALAVGLIDNLLGPYMMSRGNNVHPFLLLLSVLGGITLFGPIGFILGPVILSLFLVFLELYHTQIKSSE